MCILAFSANEHISQGIKTNTVVGTYRSTNLTAAKTNHATNRSNSRIVDLRVQHDIPHEAQAVQHRDASTHFGYLGGVSDASF